MAKLKVRTEKVIDVSDWDDLVIKTYGKPYSFQQQDGCQERGMVFITIPEEVDPYENDTIPEEINGSKMGVSFKAWLARDPKVWNGETDRLGKDFYLELFWNRNFYPQLQEVANDLHAKGLIPEGDYLINIDW